MLKPTKVSANRDGHLATPQIKCYFSLRMISTTKFPAIREFKEVKNIDQLTDPFDNRDSAHPRARELMKEEFFWDCVDEDAPFGSDDGATSFDEWRSWRQRNPKVPLTECFNWILSGQLDNYNQQLCSDEQIARDLDRPGSALLADAFDMFTLDTTIISTALSQLIDEGAIDADAKPYVEVAITRQAHKRVVTSVERLKILQGIATVVREA